ncbi:neural cell adhesion molecule 1, partial [Biomphalaria glabrata]
PAKPNIDVPTTNVVAIENQPFTLTCNISTNDTVIGFYWTKSGSQLNTSDTLKYSGGTLGQPSLTVLSAIEADAGLYRCVASNSVGTTTSAEITVTVT